MEKELMNEMEAKVEEMNEVFNEEYEGSGILKKVICGIAGITVTAGGVVIVKNWDKIKDRKRMKKIRELEKEGYIVQPPQAEDEIIDDEAIDDEEE